ncbi:hypothetical protein [Streptomyces sp. UG1]|uniref:hypothetical protein n=1 Tax=Streptomyces sp. UG1 TaxID=3417652 RepID=UPI003CFA0303
MKRRLTCLIAFFCVLSAGCGIGSTGPVRAGGPASGLREPGSATHYARLYFVGPYGIQPATREVDAPTTPQQALDLLLKGPDAAERARGLITEVPLMDKRPVARAADGAVDLHLPVPVANMTGGGGLGLTQIICTAANARAADGRQPSDVDVRVYEKGFGTPWTIRCNEAGNIVPAPEPATSQGATG